MTIYTAEHALNPEKKDRDDFPDVEIQVTDEKKALTGENEYDHDGSRADDYVVYKETTAPVVTYNHAAARRQRQVRRRNMCLLPLLLLGMLLGVTVCIFGSMQLWTGTYYTVGENDFRGRCGVGIVDMSKYNSTDKPKALKAIQDQEPSHQVDYAEDIEIKGNVETMTIPKKGNSSAAVVRNDFDKNFTAIRDDLREICLLMPFLSSFLDGMVPNPANFSFYLQKIEIEETVPVVYEEETYFQTVSQVTDVSEYGLTLAELCQGVTTYRTEPVVPTPGSTAAPQTTTPQQTTATTTDVFVGLFNDFDLMYSMYPGGDALFNYHVHHPYSDPFWY